MPVGAGELRHRLTLYAPEGTRDEGSPADLATGIPAKIAALAPQFQQRERLEAGGVVGQTLYAITLRYRDDVASDLRLLEECCTERIFHILNIVPSEKMDWLELTCVVGER